MVSDKGCQAKYDDTVSSPLLTEATISIERRPTETLTSSPSLHVSPLPTLPFDLIPEILCRLSVKLLMQFRCVCKLWNSIIIDSKFAKNHLRFSTTRLVHSLTMSYDPLPNNVIKSYPLDSVFSDLTTHVIARYHPNDHHVSFVGSCNGIICLVKYYRGFPTFQLWNPSIRKFKELPPLENQQNLRPVLRIYGFGYDVHTNNYKVVVVSHLRDCSGNLVDKHKVMVHTLGTNAWKSIEKFPSNCDRVVHQTGRFVSGTINWLVYKESRSCIASFNLGNESNQEVSLPDNGELYADPFVMGVLRDCLCMVFGHDVWVMKEHGNKESWTKLFTISYLPITHSIIKVVNISEENQVLLKCREEYGTPKWIIYNSINGTFEFTQLENTLEVEVCVESLISPCS